MFIQVIQGTITDRAELKAALDRWQEELAPRASGWLGTTCGVTADDTMVLVARFDSERSARTNSDRPEQHQWWMETSKLFSGEATFHDCTETYQYLRGGSDDAGFVQVIQGRMTDPQRARQLTADSERSMPEYRPDVIGGTVAVHPDGGFTETVYFTSEAEAREGERRELPAEGKEMFEEWNRVMTDLKYYDLTEPWLYSPRR